MASPFPRWRTTVRQERTLSACRRVLDYARSRPELLRNWWRPAACPWVSRAAGSGTDKVPETMERHRKYLVAILLAFTNGYEIIRGHLRQYRPGERRRPGNEIPRDGDPSGLCGDAGLETGRFLKAANLRYQVGETVEEIVELKVPGPRRPGAPKPLSGLAARAACVCLVFFGYDRPNFTAYGTLRIQINPTWR